MFSRDEFWQPPREHPQQRTSFVNAVHLAYTRLCQTLTQAEDEDEHEHEDKHEDKHELEDEDGFNTYAATDEGELALERQMAVDTVEKKQKDYNVAQQFLQKLIDAKALLHMHSPRSKAFHTHHHSISHHATTQSQRCRQIKRRSSLTQRLVSMLQKRHSSRSLVAFTLTRVDLTSEERPLPCRYHFLPLPLRRSKVKTLRANLTKRRRLCT